MLASQIPAVGTEMIDWKADGGSFTGKHSRSPLGGRDVLQMRMSQQEQRVEEDPG